MGGVSGVPSFFQEACLRSGRVTTHLSHVWACHPGNTPRDPSLITYCPSPHLHVASQPRTEAVPQAALPSIPRKGPPPPAHCTSRQGFHPGVGPEGWMASVASDPQGRQGTPNHQPSADITFHPALKRPEGTREGTTERESSPVTSPTQPHSNRDLNIFPEPEKLKSNPPPPEPQGPCRNPYREKAAISRFPQTPGTQSQGSLGLDPASMYLLEWAGLGRPES